MMSRVKQRVAIGCPRSPLALCTVVRDCGGGGGRRAAGCAHALSWCCVITHPFVILLQGQGPFLFIE